MRTARALTLAIFLLVPAAVRTQGPIPVRIEPQRPTSADPIHVTVSVLSPSDPDLFFAGVVDRRIRFEYFGIGSNGPLQTWTLDAVVGPLPAGLYAVELVPGTLDGLGHFVPIIEYRTTFEVTEAGGLSLAPSASTVFGVALEFEHPAGSGLVNPAHGVGLTPESGYFWFFNPVNAEVTVKILDGRAVNGRYWVFLSSMTDRKFTATVTGCPANPQIGAPCIVKTYHSTQGVNRNVIDVNFQGF
jgi:hypothetical protein